ncbi:MULTISPECIES: protein-L-isoaspartate O-methyltransferase [unclassified Ruegeria]|uniref:protein-L-isoaspartate O-methyltransferase family protein n=1 Tax=unclassified Ruegeria TaxID=2625375 RepID=UPI0014899C8B|nr:MULTISPECIES: protein-L-isoaspartate O-methyltransferase [unclassified Ruegeria]NOD35941.1 protein-L-isoaspartate O-methyltransferase [Ruegeria sp. HKCCD7296]NOD47051.1 protein-L-isoaspartate O-methyltransferase [Ruegeria sp. HKCCD5849]NOD51374.1 protein-L-isoaspartate O-methyltransferase [Ruegeria sp. HKCCD5851]NOD68193.1 protein-L-isoaspartate O-methyltransferase [Ruegeria sp. HKCCD7303]NOE33323.1 protein-L-isoaspartate O-methyltransferase [Ruegeria sp. HKCCD7318]
MKDFAARRRTMVDTQVRPSDVTKFPIIDAMLHVPRENFVPNSQREAAYADAVIDMGNGRAMIEPRTLAKILDALNISNDEMVLDIAPAMGYSTAVAARMAQLVVGVESDEALAAEAQSLLAEADVDNAIIHVGPLEQGVAEHGPYDVIMVQGGVEQIPAELLDQLKEHGRIACLFVEGNLGTVRIGRKSGGQVSWRDAFNASAPVLEGFSAECAFSL